MLAGKGTPTWISVRPMRPPPSATRRKSAHAASTAPPATAWPFTAATTGFGKAKSAAKPASKCRVKSAKPAASAAKTSKRSSPAEKKRPVPVSTSARVASPREAGEERLELDEELARERVGGRPIERRSDDAVGPGALDREHRHGSAPRAVLRGAHVATPGGEACLALVAGR